PVGQGVAVRAEGDEVHLLFPGAALPPGYHVVDLQVPGGIAQGASPPVPTVYPPPEFPVDVRVHSHGPSLLSAVSALPLDRRQSRAAARPGEAFTLDQVVQWE